MKHPIGGEEPGALPGCAARHAGPQATAVSVTWRAGPARNSRATQLHSEYNTMSLFDCLSEYFFPWRSIAKQLEVILMRQDDLDEALDEATAKLGMAKTEILAKIEELTAALGELSPEAIAALDRLNMAVNDQLNIVQEPEPPVEPPVS